MDSTAQRRFAQLDDWRVFSCLLVLLRHSNYYAVALQPAALLSQLIDALWFANAVFFVISGYCIAGALQRASSAEQFLWRRLRRVLPAWWAANLLLWAPVEAVTAWWPGLLDDSTHRVIAPGYFTLADWLGNLFLSQTFVPGEPAWLLGQGWSLGYELQFYILVAWLLLLPLRYFPWATYCFTALFYATRKLLPGLPVSGTIFDGVWFCLVAGIIVHHARQSSHGRIIALPGLTAAALFVLRHGMPAASDTITRYELAAFVFGIILISSRHHWRWPMPVWWQRLLPFTFAIYLVHWPIVKAISHASVQLGYTSGLVQSFVVLPLCVAASLLAARAFHLHVELPLAHLLRQERSTLSSASPLQVR
jgi:exopolysaccharide production protein ExoZ